MMTMILFFIKWKGPREVNLGAVLHDAKTHNLHMASLGVNELK